MSTLTTPEQISAFRELTLLRGLKLELQTGMTMTRGRTCYAIVKKEYGYKGGKQKVYDQLKTDLTERGVLA